MERKKPAQVTIRLTEEKAHEFKVQCAMRKTTIQKVLEKAVDEFLADKNKPE